MLNKKYLGQLRKDLHDYALVRRDVISQSGIAIHHAKRAIFALHRGDTAEAEHKLADTQTILSTLLKKYKKYPAIQEEGAYKAAVEEFVEAVLFRDAITKTKLGAIQGIHIDGEVFLAGLGDVPGELYRYAIRAATHQDLMMVEHCAEMANAIIGELIEFDATSYLRTKFDQAKQATQKLEQVVYEVTLSHRL